MLSPEFPAWGKIKLLRVVGFKMAAKNYAQYGSWAFIIGLVIAILAGFVTTGLEGSYALILGILGLIVGILNVRDKEITLFLVACIAFIASASSLANVVSFSATAQQVLQTILSYIVVFVAPAAAIVGLRAIYDISKEV